MKVRELEKKGLTEADNGREDGEFGITNALRNSKAGNGNTSKQIILKHIQIVFRKPFQYGYEILEPLFHSL